MNTPSRSPAPGVLARLGSLFARAPARRAASSAAGARAATSFESLVAAANLAVPTPIPRDEVSDVTVAGVLAQAFVRHELTPHGDLRVIGIGSSRYFIQVRTDLTCLRLTMMFRPKDSADRPARLELVNRINAGSAVVRACIDADGDLVLDWYLPYHDGLPPRQFIESIRHFEYISQRAVGIQDVDNILG